VAGDGGDDEIVFDDDFVKGAAVSEQDWRTRQEETPNARVRSAAANAAGAIARAPGARPGTSPSPHWWSCWSVSPATAR
jgi:hypothetical protein